MKDNKSIFNYKPIFKEDTKSSLKEDLLSLYNTSGKEPVTFATHINTAIGECLNEILGQMERAKVDSSKRVTFIDKFTDTLVTSLRFHKKLHDKKLESTTAKKPQLKEALFVPGGNATIRYLSPFRELEDDSLTAQFLGDNDEDQEQIPGSEDEVEATPDADDTALQPCMCRCGQAKDVDDVANAMNPEVTPEIDNDEDTERFLKQPSALTQNPVM